MKKSLEAILFLYFTRKNTAFALPTSKRMDHNHQNNTHCESRKKANAGTGMTIHPKANAKPNGQNRKAGEMNPGRQLWIFSDSVIPPFLILFVITCRFMLEPENNPFHTAMGVMPDVRDELLCSRSASVGPCLCRVVRLIHLLACSRSRRRMYSSVSSPLPLAKPLFFPMILKPHFCSTFIDPILSVAALANIGRSTTRSSIRVSA